MTQLSDSIPSVAARQYAESLIDDLVANVIEDATTLRVLALADSGKYIRMSNAGAITIDIPNNATVAFPIGTEITVRRNTGAGVITHTLGAGVTVNDDLASSVPAGEVYAIKKVATDTWDFI